MAVSTIFPTYNGGSFLTDRGNEISTLDEQHRSIAELSPRELADRKPRTASVTTRVGQTLTSLRVDFLSSMPAWIEPTLKQVGRLLVLPSNWDNDGAVPVKQDSIQKVLNGVLVFMQDRSSVPQLTPTRDGGVQLDWHEAGVDLEMTFPVDAEGYAVFSDSHDPSLDWDGPITARIQDLRKLFSERLIRA